MSFVESWPSTLIRSNERLTQTPSSRSAVSACSTASVWTKQSIVAKPGWIIPAPLAWALIRTLPDGQRDVERSARFSNASVVAIARQRSPSPPGASSPRAARIAPIMPSIGSGTPITPVEATATCSSWTPAAIAAAPCMRAASSSPRRPVAAFALPALTTTARSASSRQRSWQSTTGAARTPERVKRAAETVSGSSETSRPRSRSPDGLIPARTPAARKPAASPSRSVTPAGGSTQREAQLMPAPRARRARTSGRGSGPPARPRPSRGCRSRRRP